MAVADYAHHNEEATRIWWQEEGQWAHEMNDDPDSEDWEDDEEEEDGDGE